MTFNGKTFTLNYYKLNDMQPSASKAKSMLKSMI